MPLAPEERERERPRMLYLWKKEPGECVQEHSFPKPVVSIGEGACTWSGFSAGKDGRLSLAGFVLVTGEGFVPPCPFPECHPLAPEERIFCVTAVCGALSELSWHESRAFPGKSNTRLQSRGGVAL